MLPHYTYKFKTRLLSWIGSWAMNGLAAGVCGVFLVTGPAQQMVVAGNLLVKQNLSVTFFDNQNQFVGHRGTRLDDSKQLSDYPNYVIQAVLSIEDRRFYNHFGIDPIGIMRALLNNSQGGHTQGGSTITQQLAKNLFLSSERSLNRKITEAYLALWLEANYSKDQILKMYLDRAYMGSGISGVTEAAKYYFNKELNDVSLSEAAALASMFKAPNKYNPETNEQNNLERRNLVLLAMNEQRYISINTVHMAMEYPPYIHRHAQHYTSDWYLDYAYWEVQQLHAAGELGNNKVFYVYTGLDARTQSAAETTIADMLEKYGDQYNVEQAAMVIMDTNGLVTALVGGNDYSESTFNRATQALRQPGSSFKPFVYATAIDAGILTKDTVVTDRPVCIGKWCPRNYNGGYTGAQPAWLAMARSINSISVQLSIQLGNPYGSVKRGRDQIRNMATRLGVATDLYDSQSLPIGSVEMTVLDQATAYTAFANGGRRVYNHAALRITTSSGEQIYQFNKKGEQVLSERVIQNLNPMLGKVVEMGTATAARIPGQAIGGKTGTSNNYRDAWFVGFTGSHTAAVWYGNDDNSVTAKMTGGSLPARTWHDVMQIALAGKPVIAPPGISIMPISKPGDTKRREPTPVIVEHAIDNPEVSASVSENPISKFFKNLFGK